MPVNPDHTLYLQYTYFFNEMMLLFSLTTVIEGAFSFLFYSVP